MRLSVRTPLRVLAAVCLVASQPTPASSSVPPIQQAQQATTLRPAMQAMQHHVPAAVSNGTAIAMGAMPASRRLNFVIHLPPRNQAALSDLLQRLADPQSPDYRHWLSVAEFTAQFGRTADEYQKVVAFAKSNGFAVSYTSPNRLMLVANGTAEQVEAAFHVKMQLFQHPTESRSFFAPDREPSVALDVPVAHISGLNDFARPHPLGGPRPGALQAALATAAPTVGAGTALANNAAGRSATPGATAIAPHPATTSGGTGPSATFLGSDMRTAYNMGSNTGTGQSVGLMEFSGYARGDVDLYFSSTNHTNKVAIANVVVDGGSATSFDNANNEAEVCLDIEQAASVAPGLSQVLVYIGPESFGTGVDGYILSRMATDNIAKQLSNSWWWAPDDPETDDPYFEEMAVQGQTFFNASGDRGAYTGADGNDSSYPAEDVNVTTVGGTILTTNGAGGTWHSETVWNSFGEASGGGTANDGSTFPIPSWQVPVISAANGGSKKVRNVPDVALQSDFDNYICYNNGVCQTDWGGTSFAAPRWAAWLALVNQDVVAAGHAAGLGFINPTLYAIGRGSSYHSNFHDITVGNNDTNGQIPFYEAVAGYDLATGWGSMNGASLMSALAQTATSSFSLDESPGSLTLARGGKATAAVTVSAINGFSGSVKLAASDLPSGVTAAFGSNPTSKTSALTLTASSTATLGTAIISIAGTADDLTETTKLSLTVNSAPAPGFSLGNSPSSLTLAQGNTVVASISIKPVNGFNDKVTFSATGLPSGVTATFSTNATTRTTVLTLKSTSTAKAGTVTVIVKGVSGNLTATTKLTLTVRAPSATGFNLSPSVTTLSLAPGSSITDTIKVIPVNGFTGRVSLHASGLPSGVSASLSRNPAISSSQLTLKAGTKSALGKATVIITGASGGITTTTMVALTTAAH